MSKPILTFLASCALLCGYAQIDIKLKEKPKSYTIDSWTTLYSFSYGHEIGSANLVSLSQGITLADDLPFGWRLGFIYNQGNEVTFSVNTAGVYAKYYVLDGPLRAVSSLGVDYQILDFKGQPRTERTSPISYDASLGLAYHISRMGDPLNLEMSVNYRSPLKAAYSFEKMLYGSITLALYL